MSIRPAIRIPRAPAAALPELAEFLAPFIVHFAQRPSARLLERYCTGLLTEHPRKNCDTVAAVVPGTNEQQLQHLLTDMAWDEVDLNRQRIRQMLTLETEGDAVLIVDDTGFAKQGRASAGVQRQYSGTLGKTGNCQVAVSCHYAERTTVSVAGGRPAVHAEVYMPKAWMNDAVRRRRAHVPEGTSFQTKAEIALDLLDQAKMLGTAGVPHACVTADAGYGDNPLFLNGLEARHERYVVAVCEDFTIALSRSGGASGSGEKAEAVLRRAVPRGVWQTIRWAEGRQGTLRAKAVAIRCWRIDGDGTRHVGWLIGQRSARGQRDDPKELHKYFWSNFPPTTSLARMLEYAHRRHWIEQYYEEAKTLLGWDQFQGRRYDAFHRHAVTVSLSYSFLVWLEWRERQRIRRRGRHRRAFSPSERSPAHLASDPPLDCRLAAPSGPPHIDS